MSIVGQVLVAVVSLVAIYWCSGYITGDWDLPTLRRRHVRAPGGPVKAGQTFTLEPGEQVLPSGWKRLETPQGTRYVRECSHWPRDEVSLSDGTPVAYICRRCDHDWVDEQWVKSGDLA